MNKYHKIQSIFKRDEKGNFIIDKYSMPEFEYLKYNIWVMTEKIDGTNIRVKWDGEKISFGGKSDNAQIPVFLYDKLELIFRSQTENFKRLFSESKVCLYGEGFGCFSSNTGILLSDRTTKSISTIVNNKLDVDVLTYNFKENKIESSKILNYFKYPNKKLLRIELEKTRKGGRGRFNQIVCTEDHLVYTNNGYVKAKDINISDKIMSIQRDLSFIQEQSLYGILMGDGCINKNDYSISIGHSLKQKEYIEFLKYLFGNIYIHERSYISGYGSNCISIKMSNKELFSIFVNNCIVGNKKKLNTLWLNKITPISLAFWYMDDGSINNNNRKNQKASLATQGFSSDELDLLQSTLFNKYQIKGKLKKTNNKKNQFSLVLSTEESKLFFLMIAPYIIKLFRYKLPKYLHSIPCVFDDLNSDFIYESRTLKEVNVKQITGVLNNRIKEDYVYDIQTSNENYFVGPGFLVHNSKIQKGGGNYIKDGVDFILFDVKIGTWWLKREDVVDIAENLNIQVVPVLYEGTLDYAIEKTKEGFNSTFGDFLAEGLVLKPKVELFARNGDRIITKIKHKDFKNE